MGIDAADGPLLDRCLAYAALTDHSTWLGGPSLGDLQLLLAGASVRAGLSCVELPEWRVYGPLAQREFYLPIVARTGHPKLSIRAETAMELLYFDRAEGVRELRRLIEHWSESGELREATCRPIERMLDCSPGSLQRLLGSLAARPGMYLGSNDGWALRCYLHGMDRGGDWLGLPAVESLKEIIRGIEDRSTRSYGSPFAAYRLYREGARELLSWAGIEPLRSAT